MSTTIKITKDTKTKLDAYGKKGSTYEEIILRLLENMETKT